MGEAGVLDHVKRMSSQGLVIFVSCVSVFCGGCSRDEDDVDVMPLKICLISFSGERPAQVLLCLAPFFELTLKTRNLNLILKLA